MGVERQHGTTYQLSLLEWRKEIVHHAKTADGLGFSSDASVLIRAKATSRSQIDPLLAALPE